MTVHDATETDPAVPATQPEAAPGAPGRDGASASRSLDRLGGRWSVQSLPPYSGVLAAFLVLVALLVVFEPRFATVDNVTNILRTSAIPMVLAVGVTFTILHGGIDLSVGSLLALSGVVLFGVLGVLPAPIAVLVVIAFAAAAGAATNGLLVGWLRLPPLVTTLGMLAVFRGFAFIFTDGNTRYVDEYPLVRTLGDGSVGAIPVPILIAVGVAVVAAVVLRFTYFGRDVYAVGGNREAASLSGIQVTRVIVLVYLVSGLAAGIGAVMQAGRLASVSPGAASGIELYVAAAVILGGTSLAGGRGGVVGTVVAVLFLGTVENGLTLLGVSSFWQQVATGVILVAAVLLDRVREQWTVRRAARAAAA